MGSYAFVPAQDPVPACGDCQNAMRAFPSYVTEHRAFALRALKRDGHYHFFMAKSAPPVPAKAPRKPAKAARGPAGMKVRAGQVYGAQARRGRRYVRIEQVRRPEHSPYAVCAEVSAAGHKLSGWHHGVDRGLPFHVVLRVDVDGDWAMPAAYTLEFDKEAS